jgi:hypothetical protein
MLQSHSSPLIVTSWFSGLKITFTWKNLVHFGYRAADIKFHHLWCYLEKSASLLSTVMKLPPIVMQSLNWSYVGRTSAYSVSSWRQCGDLSFFFSLTSFSLLIVGADDYCCIWSHQWQKHSVGPLWSRDTSVVETSDKTKHSQETNTDAAGGTRTRNLYSRTAADPHLRPRGMWKLSAESPTHHATLFTVWWQLVHIYMLL